MEGIRIVTYNYARRYVGRQALVHCRGGVSHYGVISGVTPGHLHIRPYPVGLMSSTERVIDVDTLENTTDAKLQTIQYGYGYGRAAVTTLALFDVLAISLIAW